MTKKEKLEMERLRRLMDVERDRAEKSWAAYREALYELVDLRLQIESIERVIRGEE